MAEISFAYGKNSLQLALPGRHLSSVLQPKDASEDRDGVEIVAETLTLGLLETCGFHACDTLLLLPDKTRNWGGRLALPLILDRLNAFGIDDGNIVALLANGSHEPNTTAEVAAMLGDAAVNRIEVMQNDAYDSDAHRYVCTTSSGVPVFLNRLVLEAKQILIAGTAVHHYFAGFGGGPKMVNPGCACHETITKNHALTICADAGGLHPNCQAGVLEGNPIQEDIRESIQGLSSFFLLETILNSRGDIVKAFAGDLYPTHRMACNFVDSLYKVPIAEKADLVIASCGGFPKDINLIQAHKTIHNAFQAVKPGGVLLIFAECHQGIGSGTFMRWFTYRDEPSFLAALAADYQLNGTTAFALRAKARAAKIVLVSSLSKDVVATVGLIAARDADEGWAKVQQYLPQNYSTYIMPAGSVTLPQIR